jgi:prepilin-type processing-associated H-X9-DG protein
MKGKSAFIILFLGLSAVLRAATDIESLCQKLPPDTVGFIASSGTDAFSDEFEASILGQIAADPQVKSFFEQLIQSLSKIQELEGAGLPGDYVNFMKEFLRSPAVLAMAPNSKSSSPSPAVYLLSKTVTDKNQLKQLFETAVQEAMDSGTIRKQTVQGHMIYAFNDPNQSDSFYAAQVNDYFIAAVNDGEYGFLNELTKGTVNNELINVLRESPSSPDVIVYYVDCQNIKGIIEKDCSDQDAEKIKKVLQSLGLSELRSNRVNAGFDGKNLIMRGQLKSPTSNGIWNAIGLADRTMFQYVAPKAMQAGVIDVDLKQVYDSILNTINQVDPKSAEEAKAKLSEIEAMLEFKIRDDFLANLEGAVMGYVMPATPELMTGGYVITARLKDPEKIQNCLLLLGNKIQSMGEQQVQVTRQETASGKQVHIWAVTFMAMMQIIPSWAIEGDVLIFTSHPELTKKVIDQVAPGQHDSMVSDPSFAALVNTVPSDACAIGLADSKTGARQLMQMLQRFWPMINMGMMNEGVQLPIMLPSIETYIEQMEPGFRYVRKTADGLEWYYQGTGLEAGTGGAAGGAMGLAILMPALNKTRKIAKRTVAAANLKSIGLAGILYADDHEGRFPSNLDVLVTECDLSPETLVSPRKPDDFNGPSYILIEGLSVKVPSPATTVLAYENPSFCDDGNVNVLYVDGHVAVEEKAVLKQSLQKTYESLEKPMPEVDW